MLMLYQDNNDNSAHGVIHVWFWLMQLIKHVAGDQSSWPNDLLTQYKSLNPYTHAYKKENAL